MLSAKGVGGRGGHNGDVKTALSHHLPPPPLWRGLPPLLMSWCCSISLSPHLHYPALHTMIQTKDYNFGCFVIFKNKISQLNRVITYHTKANPVNVILPHPPNNFTHQTPTCQQIYSPTHQIMHSWRSRCLEESLIAWRSLTGFWHQSFLLSFRELVLQVPTIVEFCCTSQR